MNINTQGINTNTVAITDYQMVASKVARVIIAFTGQHNKQSITEAIGHQFKHLATPVENSFRMVKAGVAIGYVRANTEVRVIESPEELRAGYKVMASNIMMDKNDETLWEVKNSASGKFLARHGNEDLSELVEAATTYRADVPRMTHMSKASVAVKEFVAFATSKGDMDYGFCVKTNASRDSIQVVSASSLQAIEIPNSVVASVVPLGGAKIPLSTHKRILAAGISRDQAGQEIEYYKRLYSYDAAYLKEVIKQIEGTAAL